MDTDTLIHTNHLGGNAFLAENPEAFGLVSDAHPIATDKWLIAANGYMADDGMQPPTFTVGGKGVEGLFNGLYDGLIYRTPENEAILRLTFGESDERQTHPIARYCAALTETLAYQVLTELGDAATCEDCARALSEHLPNGIEELRDVMRAAVGPRPGSERFFSVSFCACRLLSAGEEKYTVDIFSAGDFSVYLLDERGMSPFFTDVTDMLEPVETCRVKGYRMTLTHPGPFAVLLLSNSICQPSPSELRAAADRPGLLWRYRIRLEDQMVRLIVASLRPEEVAERAARFFSGRAMGQESASGAMSLHGGSFDTFRALCQSRLRELENLAALLPKGYDEDRPPLQTPLEEAERSFVLSAFVSRPVLRERTVEALSDYALTCLAEGASRSPAPEDEDGYKRLTYEMVHSVYLTYDRENDSDRTRIAANRQAMLGLLCEHWLTLRPLCCDRGRSASSAAEAFSLEACMSMQKQLAQMIGRRKELLSLLRTRLEDSLDMLKADGEDWLYGRAGDDSAAVWMRSVGKDIPRLVGAMEREWADVSERIRSMQAAYIQERERLFLLDTSKGGGWYASCQRVLDGTLPDAEWEEYQDGVVEIDPAYVELIRVLKALSKRTGALYRQISARAAERRTVQTVSSDEDWQVACMLGSLREDEAWGTKVIGMVDSGFRNEYKAFSRRWQEERELLLRQQNAYEAYRDMYGRYADAL